MADLDEQARALLLTLSRLDRHNLECILARQGSELIDTADLPSKQARGLELSGVIIRVGRPHRYGRNWWANYRLTDALGRAVVRLLASERVTPHWTQEPRCIESRNHHAKDERNGAVGQCRCQHCRRACECPRYTSEGTELSAVASTLAHSRCNDRDCEICQPETREGGAR